MAGGGSVHLSFFIACVRNYAAKAVRSKLARAHAVPFAKLEPAGVRICVEARAIFQVLSGRPMQPAKHTESPRREARLRALEVQGFKSFADDVRLDFNDGFTVVVGPNGSGKSNVVDAVKWILGEQSVKSLRGKEMTDVIFNGSSTRPPLNFAEASLIFDNPHGALEFDAPTVRVTRRVYRSGEGEYFLNKQACRLRDIKELFSGTGVGSHAYSVIEQGRVDAMLQASARDRRAIFEEAAGVSRFKVKRLETQRRLERIEQNLVRLADIVQEVDSRLRMVRSQAAKAEQYRDLTARLKHLRTHDAAVQWRAAEAQLAELHQAAAADQALVSQADAESEQRQQRLAELDIEIGDLDRRGRQAEATLSHVRERLAGLVATRSHECRRAEELRAQAAALRAKLVEEETRARRKAAEAEELREVASRRVEEAEARRRDAAKLQDECAAALAERENLRRQVESLASGRVQTLEQITEREALLRELSTRREEATSHAERQDRQIADLDASAEQLRSEAAAAAEAIVEWEATAERRRAALDRARAEQQTAADELSTLRTRAAELAAKRRRLEDRVALLEEWTRRPDALGSAAAVLSARRADPAGPFGAVAGVLADLLEVPTKCSAAADAVLGDLARALVVRGAAEDVAEALQRLELESGVMLLELSVKASPAAVAAGEIAELLGPISTLVRCRDELRPLVDMLLGRAWVAPNLERALELRSQLPPGAVVATQQGDLAYADRRVVVAAPRRLATGLIARRSEIRGLVAEAKETAAECDAVEKNVAELEQRLRELAGQVREADAEHRDAGASLFEQRQRLRSREATLAEMERQRGRLVVDRDESLARADAAAASLQEEQARGEGAREELVALSAQWEAASAQLDAARATLQGVQAELTRLEVAAAKAEQRLEDAVAAADRAAADDESRRRAVIELSERVAQLVEQADHAELAALVAESESAQLQLKKQELSVDAARLQHLGGELAARRRELQSEERRIQTRRHELETALHQRALEISELTGRRDSVAERIREDYDLDLAAIAQEATDDSTVPEDVDAEIAKLRRRLNSFGGVNLEALGELDALESRYETLHGQYEDLVEAKESLVKIIERIDAESRRRFLATLDAVREGFRDLFRKLFGGGAADLVIEDEGDVLECGVEIVARPPGKELRSISLLSGGEKTLTCVALLLAIFRHRPSPFCLLDEVDAALDEPNIERFLSVLREFMEVTQFIVVTHSQRTMAAADALYGVTMQESGVSRLISVRFEDLDSQGRIIERSRKPGDPEAA